MATSETAIHDADRYLQEVAPHLAALAPDERADLLEDLAQHLREIAAEPGPPLAERLGSPAAYAAELLASAGVDPVPPPRPGLLASVAELAGWARGSSVGRELDRLSPVLRPVWWVARAYLAVSVVAALSTDGGYPGLVPRLGGNPAVGLLAFLVAVPMSVRLGQAKLPRIGRMVVAGAGLVLAVYGVVLLERAGRPEVQYVGYDIRPMSAADRGCLTGATGEPITNLFAYDAEGRLLDPILLYDQDGRPIDNLCPEIDGRGRRLSTEYRQDVNGAPVINAFPRRQSVLTSPVQPGATVRPPAVVVPRLATTTTTTAPAG